MSNSMKETRRESPNTERSFEWVWELAIVAVVAPGVVYGFLATGAVPTHLLGI